MTLSEIKELLRIVVESGVEEVEVEQDGTRVVVRRQATTVTVQPAMPAMPYYPQGLPYPQAPMGYAPSVPPPPHAAPHAPAAPSEAPAAAAPAAPASTGITLKAPIVGTFYRKPSPESPNFVEIGQHVAKGTVLCIIEAMKLMNEIEAEASGSIRSILVENGQPVEYDQPLFVIDPD